MNVSMVISVKDATTAWPHVEPWLDRALIKCGSIMSAEDLWRGVRSGNMRLWLVRQSDRVVAAFVTEIMRGSRGGTVNIVALGGKNLKDWVRHADKSLEKYSRENNCKYLVEMGRSGWARVLERLGWSCGPRLMMKVI